jgi:hypothetical protein
LRKRRKARPLWPWSHIRPGPVTRRNAGLRTGMRPQTRRTRVKSKTMTVLRRAPGSPGSWTRGRSSRRSARSDCTWPPRARQPGRLHSPESPPVAPNMPSRTRTVRVRLG